MKKLFSCIIALVILSVSVLPCFAAAPSVSIGASTTSVSVGSTVSVYVNLSAESNLSMVKFTVTYPTTHLELVSGSVSSGKLFGIEETNPSAGSVSYFGANEEDVVAGGTILKMEFKVLKGGATVSVTGLDSTGAEKATTNGSVAFSECAHANMKWEAVKASTCNVAGTKKGTCPCGEIKEEALPLAEHKFDKTEITKQPNCTETGTQVEKCTVCNATGKTSTVPAKGHQFDEASIKKQPTCTETGTAVGKCKACGFESNSPVTIPAKGHSFGDWVTTTEATQLMQGEQRRQCSVCGKIESRATAKLSSSVAVPIEPNTNANQQVTTPSETQTQPSYEIIDGNNNNNNFNDNKNDDKDKDKEKDKDKTSSLFGDELSNSDKSAMLVIVMSVLIVIVLIVYVLLLQQRKKKE